MIRIKMYLLLLKFFYKRMFQINFEFHLYITINCKELFLFCNYCFLWTYYLGHMVKKNSKPKRGRVKSFLHRVKNSNSLMENFNEKTFVKCVFSFNNYPQNFTVIEIREVNIPLTTKIMIVSIKITQLTEKL